jgi:hypothetical protein
VAQRRFALINSTPDLSGYLTSALLESGDYTPTGTWDFSGATVTVPSGTVTAHQASLSITESQISDLGTYAELGTTTQSDNYLFINRGTVNPALYVSKDSGQASGYIARFLVADADSTTKVDITYLGGIDATGPITAVSGVTATAALKGTNAGASNNVIAEFVGDSDALQIRCIAAGDYQIYNTQQGNAINIYDGTGGVRIQYNGSSNFYFDADGIGLAAASDKLWFGAASTTYIMEGNDNQIRLGTDHGYADVGPTNTSFFHMSASPSNGFYTASGFHFNGTMRRYNKGAYLHLWSSSYASSGVGMVTVSTSAASGGNNGDIWMEY